MPTVGTMSRSSSGPVPVQMNSTNRTGTDLMIDNMQLVEPRKTVPVPNHILETKIFTKVAQNSMIHAKPAVVHFEGFEINQKHTRSLTILNASSEVIRMHVIPPQTKYFYIKYKKSERMVPGLTLECTIEFMPDEWRYYYDCVRINCPGEENLLVPIHAYPVMSMKDFPMQFTFPAVPVGHEMSKTFPLHSMTPVDFEFQLKYLMTHPAFSIEPMSGIVPANSGTNITVTFAPKEFHTAQIKVQLTISQFNSKAVICCFTGYSSPGLLKELSQKQYKSEVQNAEILDTRCFSPLARVRSKKSKTSASSKLMKPQPPKEIIYQGIKFPPIINTPYAVAQVLNQEPGKLRAKDLRESVITKKHADKPSTRQMKEALFEQAVRKNVYEERQNQLRWQVKVGDSPISSIDRAQFLEERAQAWDDYKYNKRGDSIPEHEYQRTYTSCTFKRTMRDATKLASEGVQFDPYSNDMWAVRHAALNRFQQAGRKIIIQLRAEHKLHSLRKVVIDWSKKKFDTNTLTDEQKEKIEEEEEKEEIPQHLDLSGDKVNKFKFATYIPPNKKDDMAPDALGVVPFKPTEVFVKRKVPYFNLKVPKQCQLMGYKPHSVQSASSGYISPNLIRPLRSGAEDEIINLPPASLETSHLQDTLAEELIDEGDLTLVDVVPEAWKEDSTQVLALSPPEALFKPIDYPPLHIFNPAPGLQVFQSPLAYCEVDPDFHLCPLPRYIRKDHATNQHASTQRRYLDREDVVRGIMGWKKFPSQGLTSLANTPTLTAVWVPRWDDHFSGELLPQEVPQLLDGLPEDDEENIIEEEDGGEGQSRMSGVALTPEMVNAQFTLVDVTAPMDEKPQGDMFPYGNRMPSTNIPVGTHGPVPREKREEELEYFMTKKYNRLGSRINSKSSGLNNLITDPNLVLK